MIKLRWDTMVSIELPFFAWIAVFLVVALALEKVIW